MSNILQCIQQTTQEIIDELDRIDAALRDARQQLRKLNSSTAVPDKPHWDEAVQHWATDLSRFADWGD
ncbi:MAG: hypothetical protein WC683_06030 [bacterium]